MTGMYSWPKSIGTIKGLHGYGLPVINLCQEWPEGETSQVFLFTFYTENLFSMLLIMLMQ